MKSKILLLIFLSLVFKNSIAQVDIDLSQDKGNTRSIDLDVKYVNITSTVKKEFLYVVDIDKITTSTPVFNIIGAMGGGTFDFNKCDVDVKTIAPLIMGASAEKDIKIQVDKAKEIIRKNSKVKNECLENLQLLINSTEILVPLNFKLQNNQIITITITKFEAKDKTKPVTSWTFILKTEEKTRWLIHYGLTYAPNFINKVDHYYSFADTSVANKYTIKKNNNNGSKPWDNISATINFTYPFHADSRPLDGGFTAGFGLNPDLQLSGHAGLSFVIGDNVIIGSGIAFMQKYTLKGEYQENQIIKTNLDFSALHEKVWLPELYFTIGFRFNSNPFSKSTANNNSQSQSSATNSSANTNNTNSNSTNTTNKPADSTKSNTPKPKINKDSTSPIGFIIPNFPIKATTVFHSCLFRPTLKELRYEGLLKEEVFYRKDCYQNLAYNKKLYYQS